jgi:outer membrane protein
MLRFWKTTHASILMRTSGIHAARVAALLVGGFSTLCAARAGMPFKEDSEVLKELKAPPSSESQWQPPDLRRFGSELTAQGEPEVDDKKEYELAELIDLAERINPETKVAWEQAKQAASAVGLVQSQYYPVLALQAAANDAREPVPLPVTPTKAGFMDVEVQQASPVATLDWVLLDFGRRKADVRVAKYQLLAANFAFNARHQEIVFKVQSAFYQFSTARGRIDVAQSSLDSAVKVQEAAEERYKQGLATAPDVSQARQQAAQAAFDFEAVQVEERDAKVSLAEAIGILPTTPLQVEDFSRLPIPTNLEHSVEMVIDRSLEQRPDLSAKVAILREKEADIRRARAEYYPTLSFQGSAGGAFERAGMSVDGQKLPWASTQQPTWGVGLALTWSIFDGGARNRKLEAAQSARKSAQNDLNDSRDKAISQVWRYYSDTKLAIRRLEVAVALVDASEKSYQQTFEAYKNGLSNLVDLLAARRALSQAEYTQLDTRASVLESTAALAFASGDLGSQLLKRKSHSTTSKP